jgi:hypothetical protein
MRDINQRGVNFLEVLRAIPESELKKKQKAIEVLAPTLQYSVVCISYELSPIMTMCKLTDDHD